jgi:aspartyl/asparaginyl beta-hydroxylase (cupin superfamily)
MSAVPLDQAQLRALIDSAERAGAQGQAAEAERLLTIARSAAPENPDVLGACGAQALRGGKLAEARSLLERAIASDPANPRLYLNLASCLRDLHDPDAEMKALNEALALDPYFFLAHLQKGSLLELTGKTKAAAAAFHAALSSVRPGTPIPATLRPIVEHAQRCVAANFRELETWLNERMQPLRERYPGAALDRVDDCIAAFLGKKPIYVQQPTMTHFPRLPAISFFERKDFPWLAALEAKTDEIREELLGLLATSLEDFSPYVAYARDMPLNQWKELNNSKRWSALFLYKEGRTIEANVARCPATVDALSRVPLVVIPKRAPSAFFSRLEPRTRIPPHTGVTNTRLTVHIPLIIPPGCRFRVGAEVREWRAGTAFVFDDTIEHEAWNDSDEPRVVMIFDIWNPFLSEAERDLMAAATAGIADFQET